MLDNALVTQTSNDPPAAVRAAALARVPWLADFLEGRRVQPRLGFSNWPGQEAYQQHQAAGEAAWAEAGAWFSAADTEERRAAALCLVTVYGLDSTDTFRARQLVGPQMRHLDGWTPDEVAALLAHAFAGERGSHSLEGIGLALDAAERLDADGCRAVAPWLRHGLETVPELYADARRRGQTTNRLRALLVLVDDAAIPEGLIPPYAVWAAPLRERETQRPSRELAGFVRHMTTLTGPRPTQRWRRDCLALTEAADGRALAAEVLRSLAEDDPPCSRTTCEYLRWTGAANHYHFLVHQDDGDLARGLVWTAALTGGAATVVPLVTLALRVGTHGAGIHEDRKLAGAAINALAEIEDDSALEALWRLRARIRDRAIRKQVDTALSTAAARQGITAAQLVERSVPDHGLAPDGTLEVELTSGHRARLAIEDAVTVRLTFTTPDGRVVRTAPAAVKEQDGAELAQLKAKAKELRATLSGERARVEALLSTDRTWPYDQWCRHYRDHAVTGVLTRGLIWEFAEADGPWQAVAPGDTPSGAPERVRLWHPVHATADEISAWREHLLAAELRQPFKQAFREVYHLTPAEEQTGAWSNRFAAHIVQYQRLYALLKERGWQANYLSPHDGGYDGQARGEFGDGQWRAWFHHEPTDHEFTYSPDHAVTDQVRFDRRNGSRWRQVQLAEVPVAVFSEAMRDVDLFVSVTSIAADPTWADRGEHRHAAYWESVGFGRLDAGAELRREALGRIVPRLRIAGRCSLDARHLVVRGELATYRIHLGSANILMEPSGAYLCIVPARSAAIGTGTGKVFLPFEDERLSLILSKAFLLANDAKITDESILSQIRRGTR